MIVAKEKIIAALVLARKDPATAAHAHAVVAQALCIPVEAVQEVDAEGTATPPPAFDVSKLPKPSMTTQAPDCIGHARPLPKAEHSL